MYKAALFETDTRKYHHASKKRGGRSSFDPESYLKLPDSDGETEAIENALYALQALENCLDRIQEIADTLPEPVRLFPDYKNGLPLGQDCGLLTGRGGGQTHFLRSAFPFQGSQLPVSGIMVSFVFLEWPLNKRDQVNRCLTLFGTTWET